MLWIESATLIFRDASARKMFYHLGLVVLAIVLYTATVGGGFLYTVGIQHYAVCIAFIPVCSALFLGICYGAGYTWEAIKHISDQPQTWQAPNPTEGVRYITEGIQLLGFYGVLFLLSALMVTAFPPLGITVLMSALLFHPLIIVPMLYTVHDKTLLGLMDACLDIPELLSQEYLKIWFQTTLCGILAAVFIYPLLVVGLSITLVGLVCIPGLLCVGLMGQAFLMASLGYRSDTEEHSTAFQHLYSPSHSSHQQQVPILDRLGSPKYTSQDDEGSSEQWRYR